VKMPFQDLAVIIDRLMMQPPRRHR
jgi:hypothetical protein